MTPRMLPWALLTIVATLPHFAAGAEAPLDTWQGTVRYTHPGCETDATVSLAFTAELRASFSYAAADCLGAGAATLAECSRAQDGAIVCASAYDWILMLMPDGRFAQWKYDPFTWQYDLRLEGRLDRVDPLSGGR